MNELLSKAIHSNDIEKIINIINLIDKNDDFNDELVDIIIELMLETDDDRVLSSIDWLFYRRYYGVNFVNQALKIVFNKNYNYEKMSKMRQLYDLLFKNDVIADEIFIKIITKDAKKYRLELIDLIEYNDININSIPLSIENKILVFYKIIGLTPLHIMKNMKLCFDLLQDDELIKRDKDIPLVFGRFYGWNYIGNSKKFLSEVKCTTDSQAKLIDYLNDFVSYYQSQFENKITNDFALNLEILRARQRIDLEENKKMIEDATKRSALFSLFPAERIIIGNRVAYSVKDLKNNIINTRETPMQNISIKCEFPLDCIINPIEFYQTIDFFLNGGQDEINN